MIIRMLLPFLLMMIVPDLYVHFSYLRKLTTHRWVKWAWWAPTLLLCGFLSYGFATGIQHASSMKYFFLVMLCMVAPKLMFLLLSVIGRVLGFINRSISRMMDKVALGISLFLLCVMVYGSLWGSRHLTVRQVTIEFSDLPAAFDGYTLTMLTDFHIGTQAGNTAFIQEIADLINRQKSDMIVFTGDLINGSPTELEPEFIRILSGLQAPDGVYSVLGNHDYAMYGHYANQQESEAANQQLKEIEKNQLHWDLLLNEHRVIRRGNDSIVLVGVENDGNPPFPQYADMPKATAGIQQGSFQILLSHDPTHWRRVILPDTDIQLMLSGHTHATQFKLAGLSPAALVYKEWDGLYTEGSQNLFVSSGIGAVMFPFRFGAWPEIVQLTLKKK